jgi:cation transport protein ChaC
MMSMAVSTSVATNSVPFTLPDIGPALRPGADLWVFAYGSLMWDPGFEHDRASPALLRGYHRRFCIYSHRFRGTPERPGLVLGLDRGGACRGIAFRVPAAAVSTAVEALWDREMQGGVYTAKSLSVDLEGERVLALAFVARHDHTNYAGRLTESQTAELILQGIGGRGPCCDYLANTVRHLIELGIDNGPLHGLDRLVADMRRLQCERSDIGFGI